MSITMLLRCLAALALVAALAWNVFRDTRQVVVLGAMCDPALIIALKRRGWRTVAHIKRVEEMYPDGENAELSFFGWRDVWIAWGGAFLHSQVGMVLEKSGLEKFNLRASAIKLAVLTQRPCWGDHAEEFLSFLAQRNVPIVVPVRDKIPYNYGIGITTLRLKKLGWRLTVDRSVSFIRHQALRQRAGRH